MTATRKASAITLTESERRQLVRILGALQDHLESAIDSSLVPATNEPDPKDQADVFNVAADRRLWKRCETLIKRLERS